MRFLTISGLIAVLVLVGALAFFAFADIPVAQESVSVDIADKIFRS